jgi:methoxymalonate biosynthesis acyl carrier protein
MDSEIRAKLRTFIDQYFDSAELMDDGDIFKSGYVTSLFAVQLVLFVEENYHFQVDNEDLTLENFHSISALANLVARKLAQPTHAA